MSEEARAERRRIGNCAVPAAIAFAALLTALPAQAQFFGDTMSSSEIAYALQDNGYRMVGQPRRSGRYYVAEGLGSDGRRVRVLVDAYAGVVVGVKAAPQQEAQSQGFSALFAPEPRLVPPRNVPNVQQPAFRPFSQQPSDRPSSQQQPGGQAALQQSNTGQPLFQQPGNQPSFQDQGTAPAQANVRRDGDGVRPAVRTVPDGQRPSQQRALRKPVREKPADQPAVARPTGTAALQDGRQTPAKPAAQSRAAEKSTASINGPDKKGTEAGGVVAPVLLDDVKPTRQKEPPPMPQVAPLE